MPSGVSLRPVIESDLVLLHRWYNDPSAFGDYDEPNYSSLTRLEKKWRDDGYRTTWMIDRDGEAIGFANYAIQPWDDWIATIGVIIAVPVHRGQGIGSIVHRLLIDAIFASRTEVQKIEALTDVENRAERRALEKSGFLEEGLLRRKNRLRGQFRDMFMFSVLRAD